MVVDLQIDIHIEGEEQEKGEEGEGQVQGEEGEGEGECEG